MLIKYKILYELISNRFPNINIEYILHNKYINNNNIKLTFPLLIPNHDTVNIVYLFFNIYSSLFTLFILDLGSGTAVIFSCIYSKIKNIYLYLVDRSYLSTKISKLNTIKNLEILNIWSDWYYLFFSIKQFHIIMTNPPYIAYYDFSYYFSKYLTETKNTLLSTRFGFSDIYNIVKLSYDSLSLNGIILLEHNYSQSKKIRNILYCCGFINICTYKDLNKLQRITYAEK